MPIDAVTQVPPPANEPVRDYAPGSPERARLLAKLDELAAEPVPLPMTIAGEQRFGGGERIDVVQPHHHAAKLGVLGNATHADSQLAVDAALAAAPEWRSLSFDDRAAVFLRGGRPAGRAVAGDAGGGDHAGPVEDGVPGGDRRHL